LLTLTLLVPLSNRIIYDIDFFICLRGGRKERGFSTLLDALCKKGVARREGANRERKSLSYLPLRKVDANARKYRVFERGLRPLSPELPSPAINICKELSKNLAGEGTKG